MASSAASWVPHVGWLTVLAIMGNPVGIAIPLSVALGAAATAAAELGTTAIAGYHMLHGAVLISVALYQWALSIGTRTVSRDAIVKRRQCEDFQSDATHIAVCGPAGSGKSSIINALMGIPNDNGNPQSAKVGTEETTTQRDRYTAHYRFGSQFLYDFPGAGTQTVPSKNYYNNQKLWLYDKLIIVHGERFGEVELAIVVACILHGQAFAIVRSRSDSVIRNMMDDDSSLTIEAAKKKHQTCTAQAVGKQLKLAGCPEKQILEAMKFCFVVNRKDMQALIAVSSSNWPSPPGENEIHERGLIQFLGYQGPTPKGGEKYSHE